ncbi:MAG: FlgD immunoglobulin-like domain containing protein [Candidatus Eisenbacteria bacterium]
MRRVLPLLILLTLGAALPASADPGVRVAYEADLLRVTLEGSYTGATYEVYRAPVAAGPFAALSSQATLCTGDCFLTDDAVTPGATYYYRFDLRTPAGAAVSFGPYEIVVPQSPLAVAVSPNPSNARARITLTLPGSARRDGVLHAEARVLDLQGRTVRRLYAGPLARGTTSLAWDGRDEAGAAVGAGLYFVRLDTALGSTTTRVVRFR